jgi:hypothetical protein
MFIIHLVVLIKSTTSKVKTTESGHKKIYPLRKGQSDKKLRLFHQISIFSSEAILIIDLS